MSLIQPPTESRTAKTPGVVTWAFVMSLFGFVCGIPALIGVVLGIIGRPKAKAAGSGVGLATAAIVLGLIWLVIVAAGGAMFMSSKGSSPTSPTASVEAVPVEPSSDVAAASPIAPSEPVAPSSSAPTATEPTEASAPADAAPSASTPASAAATPVPAQPVNVAPVFEDGDWIVGTDFPAGKYTLIDEPTSCYWGIYKADTNQEDIIANDNVSGGHPTVALKEGQEFSSNDCGGWASEIPAANLTEFGDGVWTVERDINPGWYAVADEPDGCYWGIYKVGTNGENIIANDNVSGGHPTVRLKKGMEFKSSDCGTWQAAIPRANATTFGDGVWTVGRDIQPGKYRLTEPVLGTCYWGTYKVGSNGENIIANDIVDAGRPFVTLKKGAEFQSSDCGTWALMQ